MTVSPEVRSEIIRAMSRTTEVFLLDLTRGFFEDPKTPSARDALLQAVGLAIARMSINSPEGLALLQTYCHNLQDVILESTTS